MSKTAFVVAALFAASTAFAETPAPKAPHAPAKTQQQTAGGQSSGANVVVAGGVAQEKLAPAAMIALGVAAVVLIASMSSDSPGGPTPPASH